MAAFVFRSPPIDRLTTAGGHSRCTNPHKTIFLNRTWEEIDLKRTPVKCHRGKYSQTVNLNYKPSNLIIFVTVQRIKKRYRYRSILDALTFLRRYDADERPCLRDGCIEYANSSECCRISFSRELYPKAEHKSQSRTKLRNNLNENSISLKWRLCLR